uniref:SH3 domain-containing protein n=1 Tax=Chlamydomonas leiostraca TaxID=1034604 RepID=A0A7S0WTL6_9CHLO|mmetsp:Transcript_27876/g.71088  ORF Transcript_27876/g.71088 Transcript_27876/m.71088 type:complete len:1405 (+) Transcript_27876:188-4402(+)|eukprot:CAMPEP_0202882956 /NCGR_PEP_ID=MMETSP1391-20130828/38714_1 /ASSEMBLY_ACC=CAM_ASM_000867 /TAXON_ID=1034604 /ORGANISM="Chlamydomonas leiostraca, Strain SAG 11-49" /LENGTH=1404 /DNA_ID=CAMNT_0049565891 /DNA_START=116 /DNA_END=4330 /DNA_ORIENTATION=+
MAEQNSGGEDPVPTLNRFLQSTASKGEVLSYPENVLALAALKAPGDKPVPKEAIERQLARLLQYGSITINTVQPLLKALQPGAKESADDKSLVRVLYYLVQLVLGDGSAGTPLPVPPAKGAMVLPKAVDRFGPDVLSIAWSDLSNERSTFMRKQGAMRALAALAHASLTSRPDDPTYPAGVFVTLQSLLERIEEQRASKRSLMGMLAAQKMSMGSASMKKKNQVADFKSKMEMWGLLRLAFSAARVALSRSGISQVAAKALQGVAAGDPVCARHSLALAALVARDPQTSGSYIEQVGPLLRNNVDMAKGTGVLFPRAAASKEAGGAATASPSRPTVLREDGESTLNLRDTWARVYLARGCATAIQSGHVAGDISGAGAVFWEALVLLALADPSELVGMEAVKAMFGAPPPHPEQLKKRPAYLAHPELDPEGGAQPRVYAASWHMVMSVADQPPAVPGHALGPTHDALQAPNSNSDGGAGSVKGGGAATLFGHIASRLLFAMQSRSRALIAAACRAAGVLFEAHAWCMSLSGGQRVESEPVHRTLRVLQGYLTAAFNSEGLGACERAAAAEALVWAQLGPADDRSPLTPSQLLKVASHGGLGVQNIVKALFADPWPEPLVSSFLGCLIRRQRCAPALAAWCLELAGALVAAAPSRAARDMVQALWDASPGPLAARMAFELLGSPLPPVTQPPSTAPVEVKALATEEEGAYEGLRAFTAWWLGEHVNAIAGTVAWKPPNKASVKLPFMPTAGDAATVSGLPDVQLDALERLTLAAAVHSPLLHMAISHLQRAMLAGSWEVRVAAAQALAKVAVRSPEPYRVQAYSVLAGTVQPAPPPAGSSLGTGSSDVLGLACVVQPALEVLDAMYAGEMVVGQSCNTYGTDAKAWPKQALASVQRRHDWLVAMVTQRIGAVPKDVFFPLGRKSRLLLRPDDTPEPEAEEEEEDRTALDAAAAAAAAAAGEQPQYDQQYEDQYYDQQYYDQYDQYGGEYEADPLAKWQAGDYQDAGLKVAAVNFRPLDDEAASSATGQDYDGSSAADEDDVRWGTVLYAFSAEADEEVSVPGGARVKVHVDLGDWLHVSTVSGQQGLVPASYVQMDDTGGGADTHSLTSARSMAAPSASGAPPGGYQQEYQYGGASGGYDMFGNAADGYGGPSAYEDSRAAGVAYGAYGNDEDGGWQQKGGGGFDDFGAALAAAAQARADAQARAAALAAQMQQQASLQRSLSRSSTSSSFSAAQRSLQPSMSVASSVGGAYTSVGGASTAGYQAQVAAPTSTGGAGGFDGDASAWAGFDEPPAFGGAAASSVDTAYTYVPPQTQPSAATDIASASSFAAVGSPGRDVLDMAAQPPQAARAATALYDFPAEMENEVSVAVGDAMEVLGEAGDGWLQVRLADGRSGLVPANYVQLE